MGTASSHWVDVGGQGELRCLPAGGKSECAATATVIALPEAPDVPAQISPCYSCFSPRRLQAACTRQRGRGEIEARGGK